MFAVTFKMLGVLRMLVDGQGRWYHSYNIIYISGTCSERSGSVVECLTRDRRAAGSSLTGVTVLCPWARHINPSLELVQPRKTHPIISEKLLIGRKESNQTKLGTCSEKMCPLSIFWPFDTESRTNKPHFLNPYHYPLKRGLCLLLCFWRRYVK